MYLLFVLAQGEKVIFRLDASRTLVKAVLLNIYIADRLLLLILVKNHYPFHDLSDIILAESVIKLS